MNLRSYSFHVTGFLTLSAVAVYPWIGLAAGFVSIAWAAWANRERTRGTDVSKNLARLATVAHGALCALFQVTGLYERHSGSLSGAFSLAIIVLISISCVIYIYMFFPDGIPRKAKG